MGLKYLGIILARSGSRGIPGKNIKYLHGLPLFFWSVKHAYESKKIGKIVISTNHDEIPELLAKHGKDCGYDVSRIEVIRRPEELSTDTAMSELALIHAVQQQKEKPEFVVMLQPSSPFRFDNLIDRCIEKLEQEQADCLLTALKMPDFFWFERYDTILKDYSWVSSYHPKDRKMKQAMEREDFKWFDNGCVYITRTETLERTNCRLENSTGSKVAVMPISHIESMQIDHPEDFVIAEQIMRGLYNSA